MISDMLFRPFRSEKSRSSKRTRSKEEEITMEDERHHVYSVPFQRPDNPHANICLRSHNNLNNNRNGRRQTQQHNKRMANKVSNFSDLIHRVTASCLLHPLSSAASAADLSDASSPAYLSDNDLHPDQEQEDLENEEDEHFDAINNPISWGCAKTGECGGAPAARVAELEALMGQVFDSVSAMKRAYVSLQEAHCPWDPDKMRVADVAVVAELRRLGLLRERFRRRGGRWGAAAATLREAVAPYEAAVEELKREVKAQKVEVESLREKLKTAAFERSSGSGGKSKGKSRRRVSCTTQVAAAPAVELFEVTMSLVKEASKAFTSQLLSLMRSARWDISAAVRSIESASSATTFTDSIVGASAPHAKYALESYVNRKIFQGFDHETFYMDGSLSSILHPEQHRRDCFTQYRDMKAMDPTELLGILPSCKFGTFCFNKYLSIVHPKMEESLFGDLDQRQQVLEGTHPRTQFYGEFLGLAKAVWMLHLLAFSLDPPPSHFEASRGADFHSQYMESVVRNSSGRGVAMVVGFPVSPGFKLGNASIIKARVYLVPKN